MFYLLIIIIFFRHPSGNNNEDSNDSTDVTSEMNSSVIKSQSLPNLYRRKLMSSSINSAALSNSTVCINKTLQKFINIYLINGALH